MVATLVQCVSASLHCRMKCQSVYSHCIAPPSPHGRKEKNKKRGTDQQVTTASCNKLQLAANLQAGQKHRAGPGRNSRPAQPP